MSLELVDFLPTVFQREVDHLEGWLYIDRVADMRLRAFEEESTRYLALREDAGVLD